MGIFKRLFGKSGPGGNDKGSAGPNPDYAWIDALFPDPIEPLPALLAQRAFRGDDARFANPSSWLGGLPEIGGLPWPRDSSGRLMTHVASFDLADMHRDVANVALPKTGLLVVFLPLTDIKCEACVLHVPAAAPTPLPADLHGAQPGQGASSVCEVHADKRILPRWPVRFKALPLPEGEAPARTPLYAPKLAEHLPNGDQPWLWDSLQRFCATLPRDAETLDKAQERAAAWLARVEADLERGQEKPAGMEDDTFQRRLDKLQASVNGARDAVAALRDRRDDYARISAEFTALAKRHDRWSEIAPADLQAFEEFMETLKYFDFSDQNGAFGALYRAGHGHAYYKLADPVTETLVVMASSPPQVFRMLPPPVQEMIIAEQDAPNSPYGVQMFGHGNAVQDAMEYHADQHMLFQFSGDSLIGLPEASIKLWIRPEDLNACLWDKITVTIECD